MQPKFTLKKISLRYRLVTAFAAVFLLFIGNANAQQYINGNLSTGATSSNGTAAPAGYTWSEVQLGNSNAGFGAQISADNAIADDFTVVGTWAVSKVTLFAYSTGYASTTVSPFNDVRLQITNGDPSVGSPTVVYGDLTTNRFSASSNASMYRIFNATPGTTRIIWRIEINITGLNLTSGTYWMQFQVGTIAGVTSNFMPASTVVGTVTQPGNNAKQRQVATWANLLEGTNPQDMPFIIDYATSACSGTPAPGNTLPATSNVCPGTNFTLTLQNATVGSGVSYQWQSAPASTGPWTNITGATNASYTAAMSATTYYRCNVTCSGNTGASAPAVVNLNPPSACYCIPPNSDCSDDDVITRVRISTLDNSSTCATSGYTYYSAVPAPTVYSGAPNPITVDAPTTWAESVGVWIDYNKNGVFETTEFSSIGTKAAGQTSVTGNVVIPSTALTGTTRMRVRLRFGTGLFTSGQPCVGYTFGETEDYDVNIQPCVPVTITSSPSSTSVTCGSSTSFTVATTGTLPVYGWQWRPNATSAWFTVTNGGIYSGATTSTLTLTNVTAAFSGYQYRATVVGGCSALDVSQTATLTVNPIVAVVSPASANICNGSVQQLSLTNTVSAPTTVTFNATGLPLAIPDGSVAGVNNTIAVSGIPTGAVITEMKVRFSVPAHTWAGDLCAVIRAPGGAILNLDYFISSTGVSGTGMINTTFSSLGGPLLSSVGPPWTGTFRADAVTTPVVGNPPSGPTGFTPTTNVWTPITGAANPNGNYTFAIFDGFAGDNGSLTAWSIEITYSAPIFAQGVWTATPATPNTMFTDAAATVAYTGTPATTIYVKPTVNTNYQVSFTTPTPCTSATTTVPVNVSNTATGITVTPTTNPVCVGGNATFNAGVTGGNPLAYQWQVSTDGGLSYGNVSGATTSTLTVSNVTSTMSGNRYRVIITSAPCAAVTSTAFGTLTVNPIPGVGVTANRLNLTPGLSSTLTASSTPAASSYSWTLDGSPLSATGNTVTAGIDQLGTYTVKATTAAGCTSTSSATVTIGAEASDRLWIYPNPNTGAFQVRLYYVGTPSEKRVVNLYNSAGQLVVSKEFDLTNLTSPYLRMDFNLGPDARGTYVVKVVETYTGRTTSGLAVIQ